MDNKKITVKDPKNPAYAKDYPYTSFKFTDKAFRLPLDWTKMFKDIQGVQFDSIIWNNNKKEWSYSGKIYEKTPEMIKEEEDKAKAELEKSKKQDVVENKTPTETKNVNETTKTTTPATPEKNVTK